MTSKKLVRQFWIVILVLVIACGKQAASVTPTSAPTSPVATTHMLSPIPASPTSQITSTPTSLPVSSPPDGLRLVYVVDGNLFFQDGSNQPLQLTDSGEDNTPIFSDDGEKIVFLRGSNPFNLYSINADGSQEQVLVTNRLLMALDSSSYNELTTFYSYSLTIIPGTHLLLFETEEIQSSTSIGNRDLLMVDTDTTEIKRLLPPNHARAFYVSPDGKFIAIDARGSIDVIDIRGKIISQNLLTYTPSEPTFLAPGISWMPDAKGLIVILPVATYYETSASGPSYTIWRYTLDDGIGVQVPLDILPTEVYMATVSPDGNWAIYNNNDQYAFYIGDLRTGNTQLYEPSTFAFHYEQGWNPDSKYFIYRAERKNLFLGSVNNSPELIGKGDFLGWIDLNRYLYYANKNIVMGDVNGLKEIILADHEFFNSAAIFTFILPQTQKR